MLVRRGAVSANQRKQAAQAARQLFVTQPLFQQSQRIACYISEQNEFDCMPLIQEIWRSGKKCYLPILSAPKDKHLLFALYQADSPLQRNRYKIHEPVNTALMPSQELDLVIVPLVGFDSDGRRIGMGRGYYDRTFAFKQDVAFTKPFLLGLAYGLQRVEKVISDPWDVALNGVLTEHMFHLCRIRPYSMPEIK